MAQLKAWLGPGLVFATLIAALATAALSPKNIKRRLRLVMVLCLLAGVLMLAVELMPETAVLYRMLLAGAALFEALAIARLFFVLAIDIGWERGGRSPMNQLLRDVLQTVVYAAAALVGLRAAGVQPTSLLATGTVVTAVVGLSLQETLGNLAAGVALEVDKPLGLGDWVRLDKGDVIGRVVSTNWRSVTIQGDDRLHVVVPNNFLSRSPFTNFSRPGGAFRRNIYFIIPFEVPPSHVHEAVLAACADSPMVLDDPPPSILTWAFLDHGVQYWLRFFIADFALRDKAQGDLQTRIWFQLKRRKIEFAVPLRKTYMHEVDEETIATMNAEVVRDRRAAIDAVDFLRPLSSDAKDTLARRGHRKLFGASETIIRAGDRGREFYIIRRGQVAIRVGDKDIAHLGPGEFFGELALLTGRERHANVVALAETEVFEVDEHMFKDVLQQEPKIAEEVSRIVATRQAELEARLAGTETTEQQATSATTEILSKIKALFGLN